MHPRERMERDRYDAAIVVMSHLCHRETRVVKDRVNIGKFLDAVRMFQVLTICVSLPEGVGNLGSHADAVFP